MPIVKPSFLHVFHHLAIVKPSFFACLSSYADCEASSRADPGVCLHRGGFFVIHADSALMNAVPEKILDRASGAPRGGACAGTGAAGGTGTAGSTG